MRWFVVVLLGACNFTPHPTAGVEADAGAVGTGGSGSARDAAPDVALDAPVTVTCSVDGMGTPTTRGALGSSNGGSSQPDLTCPAGELPIGFSFATTATTPMAWSQHVVQATHVRCGKLEALSDGSMRVTPDATLQTFTAGDCMGWPASVEGAELDCPAGSVVIAMSGNEATSGGTHTLFDTVAMTCAVLDATGQPTATQQTIAFPDTSHDTDRQQAPACASGEAVVQFGIRSGCGQDTLALKCAPLVCM